MLVGCADTTTTTQMAFIARYSAGRPRIAIHLDDADPVNLPAEVADVTHGGGTPAEIADAEAFASRHGLTLVAAPD